MATISLHSLRKQYGNNIVVNDLDLEIKDGEFVVLVGPSGCGKSTLLRMLAGLLDPDAGQISIDGKDVTQLAAAQRNIAMVFQSYALYPHMTVRQNIGFPLMVAKLPKAEIEKRVTEVAQMLDITSELEKHPRALSGGQRQRVAMGRAMIREPKVFLFDEPLSNLDAGLRSRMRSELGAMHRRLGTTMIYVTHDQHEAMTLADRLILLNDGKIEQMGSPMDVYANPISKFAGGFLGNPPMNFLRGKSSADGVEVAGRKLKAKANAATQEVFVGIRPEHIRLSIGDSAEPGSLSGKLVWQENTGSDCFVHTLVNDENIVVRLPPQSPSIDALKNANPDDMLNLHFEDFHLFDGDSGKVLEKV